MIKIKNDRVMLLKSVRELVIEQVENISGLNNIIKEVGIDYISRLQEKRKLRRLKLILKELNEWIPEMISEKKTIKSIRKNETIIS